jgi:hypothetical protein
MNQNYSNSDLLEHIKNDDTKCPFEILDVACPFAACRFNLDHRVPFKMTKFAEDLLHNIQKPFSFMDSHMNDMPKSGWKDFYEQHKQLIENIRKDKRSLSKFQLELQESSKRHLVFMSIRQLAKEIEVRVDQWKKQNGLQK